MSTTLILSNLRIQPSDAHDLIAHNTPNIRVDFLLLRACPVPPYENDQDQDTAAATGEKDPDECALADAMVMLLSR